MSTPLLLKAVNEYTTDWNKINTPGKDPLIPFLFFCRSFANCGFVPYFLMQNGCYSAPFEHRNAKSSRNLIQLIVDFSQTAQFARRIDFASVRQQDIILLLDHLVNRTRYFTRTCAALKSRSFNSQHIWDLLSQIKSLREIDTSMWMILDVPQKPFEKYFNPNFESLPELESLNFRYMSYFIAVDRYNAPPLIKRPIMSLSYLPQRTRHTLKKLNLAYANVFQKPHSRIADPLLPLSALKEFINLTDLDLTQLYKVVDNDFLVEQVSHLKNLRRLDLSGNKEITSLKGLAPLREMRELILDDLPQIKASEIKDHLVLMSGTLQKLIIGTRSGYANPVLSLQDGLMENLTEYFCGSLQELNVRIGVDDLRMLDDEDKNSLSFKDMSYVKYFESLTSLTIRANQSSTAAGGVFNCDGLIEMVSQISSLKSLSLYLGAGSEITPKGMNALVESECGQNLVKLSVFFSMSKDCASGIFAQIGRLVNLEVLEIDEMYNFNAEDIIRNFGGLKKLRRFLFSSEESDKEIDKFLRFLEKIAPAVVCENMAPLEEDYYM